MDCCPECGSHALIDREFGHQMTVTGHTFTALLPAIACKDCEEFYIDGAGLGRFELLVARELANVGERSGEAAKFMRRSLDITSGEFAKLLNVATEAVVGWERGETEVSPSVAATLAALVDDHLEGRTTTLMRLQAFGKPPLASGNRDIGRVNASGAELIASWEASDLKDA
jgi:putative zinc finger/helix-turn-helix YgiT family protein